MTSCDAAEAIQQAVRDAIVAETPLAIVGGGSKAFYGREPLGKPLNVGGHIGIVDYHPSELVITARAGTSLAEVRRVLAERGQMLAFEPPAFADSATLGGTLACGFSGSRRPFTGSARDFVLGCQIIDGRGDILSFGGEVMKNVAGYDVSRLMVGALGTLGVCLQASLKVLPLPQAETTLSLNLNPQAAQDRMRRLSSQSLPLSGLSFDGERLYVRLSGVESAVRAAVKKIGGDEPGDDSAYWRRLNEQQLSFFQTDKPLWRLSMAPATPALPLAGQWYLDWGGALRWLVSDEPSERIFAAAVAVNGHATLFRNGDRKAERFQPLSKGVSQLQQRIKNTFDPQGVFNPQRIYPDW